ncbi:hypothetical protein Rfer_4301 (plasmid) [Rhodoferax ferrireducens T118]|uniref:Uncharacterized protein n=1 Tax=Albidiferax ferrireducens (strain ATCC BAA-621 / DSM 15236 / T118) TaxID=338969 RepID=Q21QF8_ALBFT|nr:hypothetical protein [Rhodoferax ferrireducens]ABD71987.1 hypothetical protein Rfer_4301 [Rhodoferax ferrireducens T118]
MRASPMSDEQTKRVTLGVLRRIHGAMASIEACRLSGEPQADHPSIEAMTADYQELVRMRAQICNGENLATTQHSRLFVMRELTIAGVNSLLPDADYILSEKAARFTCGTVSIRLSEANDGKSVICKMLPLGHEDDTVIAQCEAFYNSAREPCEAVPS